MLYEPGTLFQSTNSREFWTESTVNSLGFLEREPLPPERAKESCHVSIIGDSFIEGNAMPLAKKFPVLLEDFARRDLPELDITTLAFGRMASSQIHQIPFYDHYASKMNPDLLILAFSANDIYENSSFLRNLNRPWDPDRPPHAFAQRSENGEVLLYPPDPEFFHHQILPPRRFEILPNTFFGSWLSTKASVAMMMNENTMMERVKILRKRSRYASLTSDWDANTLAEGKLWHDYLRERPLIVMQEALDFMAFALDQFQERTDRDGASLAVLANEWMTLGINRRVIERPEIPPIDRLREMANAREIPVIDLYSYVFRRGGENGISGMHFKYDAHWNETGHRLAANAVLEYLKENQAICDTREVVETVP